MEEKTRNLLLYIVFILIMLFLTISMLAIFDYKEIYLMPNSIECLHLSAAGSNYEFYSCSDGNRYINPEYYHTIKVYKKYGK